jgi:hypothetical protein
MGYYIPGPMLGKANRLLHSEGATRLAGPDEAREAFAAGFAYCPEELEAAAQCNLRTALEQLGGA